MRVSPRVLSSATAAAVFASIWAESANPVSVSIEVTAQLRSRESLEFGLVLKGPKKLDVPLDVLPWGAYPDLQIVAVRTDEDATVLPRPVPFREPVESPVTTLVAGRRLQGRVQLSEYVDGLAEALRNSDVVVFWSYRLDVPGDGYSNRTGGWVALPREK